VNRSDGTSIGVLNRTVSNDAGHESGIGSDDSDTNNDADPSPLAPSTPASSHPSSSDDPLPTLDDHRPSTSGGSVESISGSGDHVTSGLQHLAERYAGDVPHDVMDVRLPEAYARLVLPPPPPEPEVDGKPPEVDLTSPKVDSVQFRSPVYILFLLVLHVCTYTCIMRL